VASIAAIAGPIPSFVTFAILLTVFAKGIFLINFLWSLATTPEWSVPSPPPAEDFGLSDPVVYRGAYEFSVPDVAEDFVPQHLAPEQVVKARQSGK
jgi:cytochrome c oxidase subunit 1